MKRKSISILLIIVMSLAILTGCGGQPAGIIIAGGETCYAIDLNGTSKDQYFTTIGNEGTVTVGTTDFKLQAIHYSKIEEGGWIAYKGNIIVYIPASANETIVKTAASSLAHDCSAMSVEEAKEYIPWLKSKD